MEAAEAAATFTLRPCDRVHVQAEVHCECLRARLRTTTLAVEELPTTPQQVKIFQDLNECVLK